MSVYPSWRFCADGSSKIIYSAEDERDGWRPSPADFTPAPAAPAPAPEPIVCVECGAALDEMSAFEYVDEKQLLTLCKTCFDKHAEAAAAKPKRKKK